MAQLWRDPGAFRADPAAVPSSRPSPRQSIALTVVLVLVVGAAAAVAYLVRPERARAFDLFSGSIFLADSYAPVSVDLATGSPSVRLLDATAQVGATPQQSLDLGVTPLAPGGGTLLLDTATGEFNMVDSTGFVIKRDGGVPLPAQPDSWAVGLPADEPGVPDFAYIEQSGRERTAVYLVSQETVRDAVTSRRVRPRAAATIDTPSPQTPGGQTTANGSFWLLTGTGTRHSVVQLSLPPKSRADGAVLRSRTRATLTGPAALGSAMVSADAGAASAVAVATPGRVEVFAPNQSPHTATFTAPPGVDKILPVTDQAGRLTFLLHGSTGWSIVSVNTQGGGLRGPTPIADLSPTSNLATPAASGDDLYTIDTTSGQIISIGDDGAATLVPGAPTYPLVIGSNGTPIEPKTGFADAYVIARGARVFYDSPSHRDALALFTDGSRPPFVIEKSAAVGLNAAGDAAALSASHHRGTTSSKPGGKTTAPPPKKKVTPVNTAVNNNIDCANTTQKPHIPIIYGVQNAARSVTFHWEYPRINNQDCVPRTYVITTRLDSGNAPPPPQAVTVQDQQAVTLTGLYPSSTYSITVTAYLGRLSTTSPATQVQTSPQGPDAPTDLRVRADSSGDWVLSWNSCGRPSTSCVPSASWEVQPQICDGNGLVASLNTLAVQADPTTRRQPTAVYRGGTALLGRGLSFRVLGHGVDNLPGTISASTPCVYSWMPPVPAALSLHASAPQQTSFDTTTTAQAVLNLGANPIRDVGGVGAHVTFALTGNGATQTKGPFTVDGATQTLSAFFTGIAPGVNYSVSATVTPAHAGKPVVVHSDGSITTRSTWPRPTVRANCSQTLLACALDVHIGNVSSADARGELFSLTNSTVRCGDTGESLTKNGFDPATDDIRLSLSQLDGFYDHCSVTVQLVEDAPAGTTLVYGGTPSPSVTRPVSFGPPAAANLQTGDFDVSWSDQGGTGAWAEVRYTGSQNLADLTKDWQETLQSPVGTDCGNPDQTQQPGGTPGTAVYIPVDPQCIDLYGALPGTWTVKVSYDNQIDGSPGNTNTYQLANPPPGYQNCDVVAPAAAWGATLADGIAVTVDPSSKLAGCSGWQYTIDDADGTQICTVSTTVAAGNAPPVTLDTSLCGIPPADGWTVDVQWNDTAGNPHDSGPLAVTGTPPTS